MVKAIGRWFTGRIKEAGYASGFLYQVLSGSIRFFSSNQVGYRVLFMQIIFTGVQALGVIALISMALGVVIIIQGITLLPQFGQGSLIYSILVTVITRELGPLLTAFVITARSATAIATELGNMCVSHEIEAYISVGINPISYIVVPRFLGVTLSLVILNLYFNLFGLGGSFIIAQFINPIALSEYTKNLIAHIKAIDILSSLVKSVVFGSIISFTATYNGFKVSQSTTEIPQTVIKAVGQGFVYCIVADAVITLISYL